jgi:PAS domain S-box-containing protein
LRESEEIFRNLLSASFDGIIIHERGCILNVNQALADAFGYPLSELIGRQISEFVSPESWQLIQCNVLRGYDKPYEIVGIRKDGSTFFAEALAKDCHYGGRPVRVGAVRDITARKRAEEALCESEEKFRAMASMAQDAIVLVNGDAKPVYLNPAAETILGFSKQEISGENCLAFLPEEERESYRKRLTEFNQTGQDEIIGKTIEIELQRKDGARFLAEVSISGLRIADQWHILGFFGTSQSASKQRRSLHIIASSLKCWRRRKRRSWPGQTGNFSKKSLSAGAQRKLCANPR